MRPLYIKGLVRVADTVRRELSKPLAATRKADLRRWVADSIREVDRILTSHQAKLDALPAPTRRAYQFLTSVNFDSLAAPATAEQEVPACGNVSLRGLRGFWDQILHELARPVPLEKADTVHRSIRTASENIERHVAEENLAAGDLTVQSRQIRGWLAFFSQRENFDAYLAALGRAQPPFEEAMQHVARFRPPIFIQFRPVRGLYRIRGHHNGTYVALPVPMICFSPELFTSLAKAALGGGGKQSLMEATLGDPYQAIQAELEALSGVDEHVAGVHHDLLASFERVHQRYFGGTLARPRLVWSRAFTGCKFGHHDPIRDTVMISCTLDGADVPDYALDFVMYHELLHKKLGVRWNNGRQAMHTPEFRREEQRFEQRGAAEAVLKQLTRPGF